MKYRKKPVEIEAFQYDGDFMNKDGSYYVPEWAVNANLEGVLYFEDGELFIKTLEGVHHASVGDYIIKGVKGEMYPCKSDIFEMTYEDSYKDKILTVVTDSRELKISIDGNYDVAYCISRTEEGMLLIADKIVINEKNFKYCYTEDDKNKTYLTSSCVSKDGISDICKDLNPIINICIGDGVLGSTNVQLEAEKVARKIAAYVKKRGLRKLRLFIIPKIGQ